MPQSRTSSRARRLALAALVLVSTFVVRIQDVTTSSLVLRDQARDWLIVQRSFGDLPLLGPATHVGGYTIGPAFYWILWLIRVVFGPWFENLPHAGGIGQALLQSAVDALLLVAIWRRTNSPWTALAVVVLLATAWFDLGYAAIIWNPVVGSTLAKCAVALVLLDWHRRGVWRMAATVAVAWMAVHSYTGTIYVAVAVCAAVVLDPALRHAWREVRRNVIVVAAVIAVLQLPYVWFQISTGFQTKAMGAVTASAWQVLSGQASPEVAKSVNGLVDAFHTIQVRPWRLPRLGLVLAGAALVVLVKYRRDPALLLMTLMPQALAIAGYAMFLARLDTYYYMSLMPSMVLTVVLAATAWPPAQAARWASIAVCAGALALAPIRIPEAEKVGHMREYAGLVRASRVLVHRNIPLRAVRTTFRMLPTGDPEYLYKLLGGKIDRSARWTAYIDRDGTLTYRDEGGSS